MVKKKQTEIITETHEVLTIRRTKDVVRVWCDACSAEVNMASAEHASVLAGVNTRALYRRVESQEIHYTETRDGQLLICLYSLLS